MLEIFLSVIVACATIGITVGVTHRSLNKTVKEIMKHRAETMERIDRHWDKTKMK